MMGEIATRKGEATRIRLMRAAQTVFVRDGYLNAEVADIAREAGKSTGTFYIYFTNKATLLQALIDEFDAQVFSRITEQPKEWYDNLQPADWRARLKYLWSTCKRHAPTLFAFSQAAETDPGFRTAFRAMRQRAFTDFQMMILGRQNAGHCQDIDPEFGAWALEIFLTGYMHHWLAVDGGRLEDEEQERRAFAVLLQVFSKMLT